MNTSAFTRETLAAYIDHSLLKPEASKAQIQKLCDEAREYRFASVCVNPYWIPFAVEQLKGSNVSAGAAIGFPFGASLTYAKTEEAKASLTAGAKEIDMVMNIGAVKSKDWETVKDDIAAVNEIKENAVLKVILEVCLLNEEEKIKACEIAKEVGADFVKTSTGFSTGGATVADVALMRKTVGPEMGVKAAGGIRTLEDALAMIEAGATRLGTSAGIRIIQAL